MPTSAPTTSSPPGLQPWRPQKALAVTADAAYATTTPETRHRDGLAVQKSIFGDVIDAMYADSSRDQRHVQRYLSANCVGDYYTRTGLDIPTRELVTFAMLVAMGGCEPQLRGHIRGNLNVGNEEAILLAVVTQLLPYVGYPRALNVISCLNE